MNDYYPLANAANTLCQAVDLLVASCNKMAPITVSVFLSPPFHSIDWTTTQWTQSHSFPSICTWNRLVWEGGGKQGRGHSICEEEYRWRYAVWSLPHLHSKTQTSWPGNRTRRNSSRKEAALFNNAGFRFKRDGGRRGILSDSPFPFRISTNH